ncbi:hypothetical protein C8J57DRAFT_1513760 [Mycena rebaudengoi]|nr:hypothetical protein C8J57DRAFT_1513760 [Mycena rebaudengoi]
MRYPLRMPPSTPPTRGNSHPAICGNVPTLGHDVTYPPFQVQDVWLAIDSGMGFCYDYDCARGTGEAAVAHSWTVNSLYICSATATTRLIPPPLPLHRARQPPLFLVASLPLQPQLPLRRPLLCALRHLTLSLPTLTPTTCFSALPHGALSPPSAASIRSRSMYLSPTRQCIFPSYVDARRSPTSPIHSLSREGPHVAAVCSASRAQTTTTPAQSTARTARSRKGKTAGAHLLFAVLFLSPTTPAFPREDLTPARLPSTCACVFGGDIRVTKCARRAAMACAGAAETADDGIGGTAPSGKAGTALTPPPPVLSCQCRPCPPLDDASPMGAVANIDDVCPIDVAPSRHCTNLRPNYTHSLRLKTPRRTSVLTTPSPPLEDPHTVSPSRLLPGADGGAVYLMEWSDGFVAYGVREDPWADEGATATSTSIEQGNREGQQIGRCEWSGEGARELLDADAPVGEAAMVDGVFWGRVDLSGAKYGRGRRACIPWVGSAAVLVRTRSVDKVAVDVDMSASPHRDISHRAIIIFYVSLKSHLIIHFSALSWMFLIYVGHRDLTLKRSLSTSVFRHLRRQLSTSSFLVQYTTITASTVEGIAGSFVRLSAILGR